MILLESSFQNFSALWLDLFYWLFVILSKIQRRNGDCLPNSHDYIWQIFPSVVIQCSVHLMQEKLFSALFVSLFFGVTAIVCYCVVVVVLFVDKESAPTIVVTKVWHLLYNGLKEDLLPRMSTPVDGVLDDDESYVLFDDARSRHWRPSLHGLIISPGTSSFHNTCRFHLCRIQDFALPQHVLFGVIPPPPSLILLMVETKLGPYLTDSLTSHLFENC